MTLPIYESESEQEVTFELPVITGWFRTKYLLLVLSSLFEDGIPSNDSLYDMINFDWLKKEGLISVARFGTKVHCRINIETFLAWQAKEIRKQQRREQEIERLKGLPYHEYLETDHWQEVRIAALKEASFRCQLCNQDSLLHVHHRTYERLGYEDSHDVLALCETCHELFHQRLPKSPEGETV